MVTTNIDNQGLIDTAKALSFAASVAFSLWLTARLFAPGIYYGMPQVVIQGPEASSIILDDWERKSQFELVATVLLAPQETHAFFNDYRIKYEVFDKSGTKLSGQPLSIPKVGAGQKAQVSFSLEESGTKLVLTAYRQ
jgi:hypothetical protein